MILERVHGVIEQTVIGKYLGIDAVRQIVDMAKK